MIEHKKHSESGQSMIEFALSLALMLMLLAGLVDLGRAIFTYMALREAAQEGAMYGSIFPNLTGSIEERVMNSSNVLQVLASEEPGSGASSLGFEEAQGMEIIADPIVDISVSFPDGASCAGKGIRVEVEYTQFPLTMPFLGAILGSQTVNISASATDTILTPACN
jgi:hypothetical protein